MPAPEWVWPASLGNRTNAQVAGVRRQGHSAAFSCPTPGRSPMNAQGDDDPCRPHIRVKRFSLGQGVPQTQQYDPRLRVDPGDSRCGVALLIWGMFCQVGRVNGMCRFGDRAWYFRVGVDGVSRVERDQLCDNGIASQKGRGSLQNACRSPTRLIWTSVLLAVEDSQRPAPAGQFADNRGIDDY
jgi:hypothetical protein